MGGKCGKGGGTALGRLQLPCGFILLASLTTSVVSFAVGAQLSVWHSAVSVAPAKTPGRLCLGLSALSQGFLDKVFRFGTYPTKLQVSYPQNRLRMLDVATASSVCWSRCHRIGEERLQSLWFGSAVISDFNKNSGVGEGWTTSPTFHFLLLLSLVDLGRGVGFKYPYVIIFAWKLNALIYHSLSLNPNTNPKRWTILCHPGPDRGGSEADN